MIEDQRRRVGRKKSMRQIGRIIKIPKQNTVIKDRLIETAGLLSEQEAPDVTFQHSIFCQTSLPYRNPGPDVRRWERRQGNAVLEVEAGRAIRPDTGKFEDVCLPFGPKARLILMHFNAEAIRAQSPVIDVGDSLTAFIKGMGIDTKGRNLRIIREQITALSTAYIRLGFVEGDRAKQIHANVVDGFEVWLPKDDRQRVLWPSSVELDPRYFESLLAHAVPLDEKAIASLSHSAMALDLYAWLAQRLHRIPKRDRQFIPWTALQDQFGPDYSQLRDFRRVFMTALRQVHTVYRAAKADVTDQGLFLYTSPPPIAKTSVVVNLQKI